MTAQPTPPSLPLNNARDALLTIGALAQDCGLTVRTLRYYEEMDLITPTSRSEGRYRLYAPRTLKRIQAIVALQNLNYSLEDILEILGPASQLATLSTRQGRAERSRQTLTRQLDCLNEKLRLLNELKADVVNRLTVIDQICSPCSQEVPELDCCKGCEHREVHVD
ncbi:MAG: MerR family transcriptional regulator [Candidatus Melainabacteria bacterium]|nr:MerR family transcriptional regulator [Candidatus Melainabacteria bacterium]